MKYIILILFLTQIYNVLTSSLNSTISYLRPKKIFINDKYYNIAKLNETCVIDESKFTPPRERGISEHNCESGLSCFNFRCVLTSRENDSCDYMYFSSVSGVTGGFDKSSCTGEFYCDPELLKCMRTKKLGSPCKRSVECINIEQPNSTCYGGMCVESNSIKSNSYNRYGLVLFFMTILLYIYYRQYKLQEAQLNRLNELHAQSLEDRRHDPETETLPPYSPPSSTFLAEAEADTNSQCSQSQVRPPSYHQYATYNSPMISTNNPSLAHDSTMILNNANSLSNINSTSNSLYPDNSIQLNDLNTNRRSSFRNSRISIISSQSSRIPNTPPPSYSQPTTPYTYNIDPTFGDDSNNDIMPPVVPDSRSSNIPLPPTALYHSLTRSDNPNPDPNQNNNRYSTLSNPESNNNSNNYNNVRTNNYRLSTLSRRRSSLRHSLSISPNNSGVQNSDSE